jgi:Fe2+ or Zn2+ uptake regulation protein
MERGEAEIFLREHCFLYNHAMAQEQIERLLKRSKLRRTPVRAGVLDILAKASRPLGAVEILEKLPAHTDAVTVYRTLNTFTRKNVAHRIRGEDRTWRYAVGDPQENTPHHHPHFVCEVCGKVECLKDAEIPGSFVGSLELSPKYRIGYAEVVLHGTCPRCHS